MRSMKGGEDEKDEEDRDDIQMMRRRMNRIGGCSTGVIKPAW